MSRVEAAHLEVDGKARCGQLYPFALTADEEAVTCGLCLAHMAGTYHVGVLRADVKPHGTLAAARRHYRRGEKPCRSCRQAEARRASRRRNSSLRRQRYAAARQAGMSKEEASRARDRRAA